MSMKTSTEMGEVVSNLAHEGKAQGDRAFEQTMSGFKRSTAGAAEGIEQAQAGLKDGVDRAMRSAEQLMSYSRGNMEAMVQSGQILAAGLQDLSKSVAAGAQQSLDETMGVWRSFAGVRSLKDAVELQTSLARSVLEKTFATTSGWTERSVRLAEEVAAPLTARANAAAEMFSQRS